MNFFNGTRKIRLLFKFKNHMFRIYSHRSIITLNNAHLYEKLMCFNCTSIMHRKLSDDSNNLVIDDIDDISQLLQYNDGLQHQYVKYSLYTDSTDSLIQKLNNCESIQEVFNTIKANLKEMDHKHISQAILVLWDLQKMFLYSQNLHYISENDPVVQNYMTRLTTHPEFKLLIKLAKEKYNNFDAESIGCFLLYISKMGITLNHDFIIFFLKLQKLFKTHMSLTALSRIIVAVRSELNLSSFFLVLDTVPFILAELENCNTIENLKLITICLNHLHQVVTDDVLEKYMEKVNKIVMTSELEITSFRSLLKILSFLHYPQWSNKCTKLSSELILHMKDHIHLLTVYELFLLFEVLFKNQEPAEILTEMQRCASRLYLNLEDDPYVPHETKLKLLSCIICFSSPLNRHEYEKLLKKFLDKPLTNLNSSFDLLRILTFVKPSDTNLCKVFWDNVLNLIKNSDIEKEENVLLRLCLKYMNSTSDIRYRHKELEKYILLHLENQFKNGITLLIPSQLSTATAFVLAFGNKTEIIDTVVNKVIQNWTQFNYLDCLYISKGLRNLEYGSNPILSSSQLSDIQEVLNKSITKNFESNNPTKNNFLLKSCIYSKCADSKLTSYLLLNLDTATEMSSPFLRNVIFCLQTTGALLPNLMNSMCDYVTSYKNRLLGFNAEKVAYLCYYLGYLPKNCNEVFQCIADIIIRDQERISGLSYIHVALALCFFNKLPDSFIKQIFNVTFLEKIDAELTTCYSKDRYPIRVRNTMMQLNRGVCLDYPEANVPWFHQKFIDDRGKKRKEHSKDYTNVRQYLLQCVDNPQYLAQDVMSAYGYHIDFLVELDENGHFINPNNNSTTGTKIAIIVTNQNAYTTINVQLKGKYQMKKRHLEILGYKVVLININEWNSLVLGNDKFKYLNKLIYPNTLISHSDAVEL